MPQPRPQFRPVNQVRQEFIDFFVQRAGHKFVASSPVVPHDDPTLLFANAGMNQFKPLFLGNCAPTNPLFGLKRAANSQKCIRAGGKHNDLDDVGKDTYHHTFFEMLGNWSFGDYFKRESIQWGWELLTDIWGLDPERIYATYFEGNKELGIGPDREAYDIWRQYLPAERILPGNMKDNFWEMGDTGPCGPCSEIHYDGRTDAERAASPGYRHVNRESPDVIEIWNHVFIQFNRTGPGEAGLKPLPAKHVDTGMGLERITRVIQGKTSNYDTDAFTPIFAAIQKICKAPDYTGTLTDTKDIAYRVIADHIRTLTFAITDGAEPGNDGRNYVLRRILRRAVRYGRQTLGVPGTFFCELVPTVVESMGGAFPELKKNPQRVMDVLRDEEEAFGRTLTQGLVLFDRSSKKAIEQSPVRASALPKQATSAQTHVRLSGESGRVVERSEVEVKWLADNGMHLGSSSWGLDDVAKCRQYIGHIFEHPPQIPAEDAFKLHDTYGFPIDLTQLMAEERGMKVDADGFSRLMEEARNRARAGAKGTEDGVLNLGTDAIASLGHMNVHTTSDVDKFHGRKIRARVCAIWNGHSFDEHLVASHHKPTDKFGVIVDKTSFYAEMGGQQADKGRIVVERERRSAARDTHDGGEFQVDDVRATGGYVIHVGRMLKGELRVGDEVELRIDQPRRRAVASNHTATHLLNLALRDALGDHVDQKGSLVAPDRLRFDFSHNASMTAAEVARVETQVRKAIDADLPVYAEIVPLGEARGVNGLRAVFGETYPDPVRLVTIGAAPAELLADPKNARWRTVSAEFCGGTHLTRTKEAQAFVLIAEEGVAKGVRRVTAVTGEPAEQAMALADRLRSRVHGAASLDARHLPAEVSALSQEIEHAVVPLSAKIELRAMLAPLSEKVKGLAKQAAGAEREKAVAAARTLAEGASGAVVVLNVPADADRDALLAALDVVKARHPQSAAMCVSAHPSEPKVTIVAAVPAALVEKGLKAGDWVREASAAVGGKGGGRPDAAQGGGTEPAKLQAAIEAARRFATSKVG